MGQDAIVFCTPMTRQKKVDEHVRFADDTRIMAFRMPKSLEKRLLKFQERIYKSKNGSRVTLTEAILTAIARGLDAYETDKAG
jgi:hypothetical protein